MLQLAQNVAPSSTWAHGQCSRWAKGHGRALTRTLGFAADPRRGPNLGRVDCPGLDQSRLRFVMWATEHLQVIGFVAAPDGRADAEAYVLPKELCSKRLRCGDLVHLGRAHPHLARIRRSNGRQIGFALHIAEMCSGSVMSGTCRPLVWRVPLQTVTRPVLDLVARPRATSEVDSPALLAGPARG
jgi:hypothetical protein